MILTRFAAVVAAVAMLTLFNPAAQADEAAVQRVITAQLEAFRANDAKTAFGFAAPGIKRMFRTPQNFIMMVERGYRPVYEGSTPTFLRSQDGGDGNFAQEVSLTDNEGRSWRALYTLAKQDDGSWRITGCVLRPANAQSI